MATTIITKSIEFSPREKELIQTIKAIAEKHNSVVRIAGGYVRDKLLGLPSNDIDITVDNMSGEEFAKKLVGEGNYSLIKANPAQSKHIATAMVNILGFDIDCANLRKETYADSRIPTIEPGTPLEDAQRRDLTINALFYNINTEEIEDFVGGFEDLQNKIARTPIDPIQTFKDDPLRILRVIRFAAKYDLKVDQSVYDAALNIPYQTFLEKVSKERIWKEMAGQDNGDGTWKSGFLSGPSPSKAYIHIRRMCLQDMFSFYRDAVELFLITDTSMDVKDKLVCSLFVLFFKKEKEFQKFVETYGVQNDISKRVNKLLVNLLYPIDSKKELRRKLIELGPDWKIAYTIFNAQHPYLGFLQTLESLIQGMGGLKVKLPINGNDIIQLGITGKAIGIALEAITDLWYADPNLTRDKALATVCQMFKSQLSKQR